MFFSRNKGLKRNRNRALPKTGIIFQGEQFAGHDHFIVKPASELFLTSITGKFNEIVLVVTSVRTQKWPLAT